MKELDEVEKYIYVLIEEDVSKLDIIMREMEIVQEYVSDAKNFLTEEDDLKFNYDREQAATEEMRKVGIQEGIKQNKITMIKAMYQDNTPIEKIAKYSEMSLKEVENILKIS